jgi:Gluconolactonase
VKTVQAELLFSCHNALGEGPLWHPAEGCLYWVDIDAGELYTSNPAMTGFSSTHFDTPLGAFCFRKSGGFILATGAGFLAWSHMQGEPSLLWNPLPPRSGVRLNDGKVDPPAGFGPAASIPSWPKANCIALTRIAASTSSWGKLASLTA